VDLLGVGLPVEAELAPALELEVLDDVGHVRQVAVDAGLGEGLVEHAPGRADERAPGPVLTVARLLADQHHLGVGGAGAEHRLGGVAVQVAGRAPGRGRPQAVQVGPLGDQVAGRARRPLAGWHALDLTGGRRSANRPTTWPGRGNARPLVPAARRLAGAHHPPFQAGRDQQQREQHDREQGDDSEHEQEPVTREGGKDHDDTLH
jgi:hypothetical protein